MQHVRKGPQPPSNGILHTGHLLAQFPHSGYQLALVSDQLRVQEGYATFKGGFSFLQGGLANWFVLAFRGRQPTYKLISLS